MGDMQSCLGERECFPSSSSSRRPAGARSDRLYADLAADSSLLPELEQLHRDSLKRSFYIEQQDVRSLSVNELQLLAAQHGSLASTSFAAEFSESGAPILPDADDLGNDDDATSPSEALAAAVSALPFADSEAKKVAMPDEAAAAEEKDDGDAVDSGDDDGAGQPKKPRTKGLAKIFGIGSRVRNVFGAGKTPTPPSGDANSGDEAADGAASPVDRPAALTKKKLGTKKKLRFAKSMLAGLKSGKLADAVASLPEGEEEKAEVNAKEEGVAESKEGEVEPPLKEVAASSATGGPLPPFAAPGAGPLPTVVDTVDADDTGEGGGGTAAAAAGGDEKKSKKKKKKKKKKEDGEEEGGDASLIGGSKTKLKSKSKVAADEDAETSPSKKKKKKKKKKDKAGGKKEGDDAAVAAASASSERAAPPPAAKAKPTNNAKQLKKDIKRLKQEMAELTDEGKKWENLFRRWTLLGKIVDEVSDDETHFRTFRGKRLKMGMRAARQRVDHCKVLSAEPGNGAKISVACRQVREEIAPLCGADAQHLNDELAAGVPHDKTWKEYSDLALSSKARIASTVCEIEVIYIQYRMKPGSPAFDEQEKHVDFLQEAIDTWDAAVAASEGASAPGRGAVEVGRTICSSIKGA